MVLKGAKSAAFGSLIVSAFWPNGNLRRHLFSLGMQIKSKFIYGLPYSLLGFGVSPSSSPFPGKYARSLAEFPGVNKII